jgi:hypothetical protein
MHLAASRAPLIVKPTNKVKILPAGYGKGTFVLNMKNI